MAKAKKAKKYENDTFDNESIHTGVYTPGTDKADADKAKLQNLSYDEGIQIGEKLRDDLITSHTSKQGMMDPEVHTHRRD